MGHSSDTAKTHSEPGQAVADREEADRYSLAANRPSGVRMFLRGVVVLTTTAVMLLPAAVAALVVRLVRGHSAAHRFLARRVVRQVERLGATFIKFGQIMATRRDALPGVLCDELGNLYDRVGPMRPRAARAALTAAYGTEQSALFATVDPVPEASGSIACVYRATLPDGQPVAIKLQRPGIRRRMLVDLSILRAMMSLAERLPAFRGVPIGELSGFVFGAILRQLDFSTERANLARLHENFAGLEYVWIPRTLPELCRPNALVMEFVPDLVHRPVAEIAPERRGKLAARTLSAVYQMLFIDGFVHCDLHPGNVYHVGSRIVILDAGFSVQLPAKVRRQFSEFFLGMALDRGRRCGEVVVESAVSIREGADLDGFVDRVADLVRRNSGVPAKEFQLMDFGTELFDLQRDFGLYAASEFVFPLMSLLVIEGTVRALDPEVDFQAAARPMLLRAAARTAAA
ncbi:hypothetical protein GCM10027290_63560 [Micromonospora sonneratiae]|uniref:ABC1 kinase family protein n=1 Tax=Micromonospora sonneratiae TaxID=1184706 RepID=A0ABW3YHP9_9ACTN